MAFEVKLFEPWVSRVRPEGGSDELPLSSLRPSNAHIHGELLIIVDGEALPHLGFFGPRDVCVNTWLGELSVVRRVLSESTTACHVFDEGEQGQPAFKFQRSGDLVEVSVVDSQLSDGIGDPEWGTRTCTIGEFQDGVSAFFAELTSALEAAAPGVGRLWVQGFVGAG